MGGPWRERSIDRSNHPIVVPVARGQVQEAKVASDAVTAAVVGFVVALVTSVGVSIACFAYLQ
jgi:uncharacterized membrane protein (DUF441 family)